MSPGVSPCATPTLSLSLTRTHTLCPPPSAPTHLGYGEGRVRWGVPESPGLGERSSDVSFAPVREAGQEVAALLSLLPLSLPAGPPHGHPVEGPTDHLGPCITVKMLVPPQLPLVSPASSLWGHRSGQQWPHRWRLTMQRWRQIPGPCHMGHICEFFHPFHLVPP